MQKSRYINTEPRLPSNLYYLYYYSQKEIPRHSKCIFQSDLFLSCSVCDPYTEKACRDAANSLGLDWGNAADHAVKGCYAYSDGGHKGQVYYGTGGTIDQMKTLPGVNKYRPVGYDCNNTGI